MVRRAGRASAGLAKDGAPVLVELLGANRQIACASVFLYSKLMSARASRQATLWDELSAPDVALNRPTDSAYWRGSVISRMQSRCERRDLGQYMTPPLIARLMARRMVEARQWADCTVRLLDPAAGSGVLASALVEAVATASAPPARIELLMCEIDPAMQPALLRCADELRNFCASLHVDIDIQTCQGDFLLGTLACDAQPVLDAVIANPPYFKLARNDPRALAHEAAVHGQPNIYGLFMTACAAILRPGGAYCFITPRSWTNGAYFRAARRILRTTLAIDALHLFDSRQAHFEADEILQEALITWGTANGRQGDVRVSTSHGTADLDADVPTPWPAQQVLGASPNSAIVVPRRNARNAALDHWPLRLADLGLRVVTGPVVGFRAREYLRRSVEARSVPMLWMPHVQRSHIDWPRGHRAEYIDWNADSQWMLLPNEPAVVLRRFSPKEDVRRVTAAAYVAELPGERIGFENHLNVILGIGEPLSRHVALGLAAWLNCHAIDTYLRERLGSTQVNAVELRELPVPDLSALESLGRSLPLLPEQLEIDSLTSALVEALPAPGTFKRARAA